MPRFAKPAKRAGRGWRRMRPRMIRHGYRPARTKDCQKGRSEQGRRMGRRTERKIFCVRSGHVLSETAGAQSLRVSRLIPSPREGCRGQHRRGRPVSGRWAIPGGEGGSNLLSGAGRRSPSPGDRRKWPRRSIRCIRIARRGMCNGRALEASQVSLTGDRHRG